MRQGEYGTSAHDNSVLHLSLSRLLALLIGHGPAESTGFALLVEERAVAGTGARELTVLFDEYLDGDACETQSEQENGCEYYFHGAKVRGRVQATTLSA
jgi:hypothetical protein